MWAAVKRPSFLTWLLPWRFKRWQMDVWSNGYRAGALDERDRDYVADLDNAFARCGLQKDETPST